eukprot:2718333-Pyramimonas_sp.AAC.1
MACTTKIFCRWKGADGQKAYRVLPGSAALSLIGYPMPQGGEYSGSLMRKLAGNAFNGYVIAGVVLAMMLGLGRT